MSALNRSSRASRRQPAGASSVRPDPKGAVEVGEKGPWVVRAPIDGILDASRTPMSDRARFLFMVLDGCARTRTICWPGADELERMTGKSARALREIFEELEGLGRIRRVFADSRFRERIGFILLQRVDPSAPAADSPAAIARAEEELRARASGATDGGNPPASRWRKSAGVDGGNPPTPDGGNPPQEKDLGGKRQIENDDPVVVVLTDEEVAEERARFREALRLALGEGPSVAGRIGPGGIISAPPVHVEMMAPPEPPVTVAAAPATPDDEADVLHLRDRAGRTFASRPEVAMRVSAAVEGLLVLLEGKTPRRVGWVEEAFSIADNPKVADPVAFIKKILHNWISEGRSDKEAAQAAVKSTLAPSQKQAEIREAEKAKASEEARETEIRDDALKARWEALPARDREAIEAAVLEAHPHARRWGATMLMPMCLAELESREGGVLGS